MHQILPMEASPELADAALALAVANGDETAFAEFVQQHGGRVLALARRMLRDEEEAQDAVQETFVAAFRAVHGFRGGARLSTWLHRIAVNVALMRLRARKRRPCTSLDALRADSEGMGVLFDEEVDAGPGPATALEDAETRARVRACIATLPESLRRVLMLRDIEGLDTAATADLLGITANAVKIRLHRARLALRAAIAELCPDLCGAPAFVRVGARNPVASKVRPAVLADAG